MNFITVYTTAESDTTAEQIARRLLEDRLVACVNITQPVRSFYRWDGEIKNEPEVVVLCKTRGSLFEAVAETIRSVHSYDTPCILAWPIGQIEPAYREWLESETRSPT